MFQGTYLMSEHNPDSLSRRSVAGKIGHDWRNPETYDREGSSVVDW
jgi:hypothetical protein